jgi:hypothetical protein
MKKSSKMITGRATDDPFFTRLVQRRNQFHGCSPNPSIVYKKGVSASLRNPRSCVSKNTQPTRSKIRCLRLKAATHSHYTDGLPHSHRSRTMPLTVRRDKISTSATTTSMINDLALEHEYRNIYCFLCANKCVQVLLVKIQLMTVMSYRNYSSLAHRSVPVRQLELAGSQ